MENMIQTFTNSEFGELEVVQIGNKFYFPATDCADKLGYVKARNAVGKATKAEMKEIEAALLISVGIKEGYL